MYHCCRESLEDGYFVTTTLYLWVPLCQDRCLSRSLADRENNRADHSVFLEKKPDVGDYPVVHGLSGSCSIAQTARR